MVVNISSKSVGVFALIYMLLNSSIMNTKVAIKNLIKVRFHYRPKVKSV